jgi:hypothetical protein
MSFALRNLCVLAYANGFTLWHYKAGPDPLDDVAGQLATGDMIMISAQDGGRLAGVAVAQGTPALTDVHL